MLKLNSKTWKTKKIKVWYDLSLKNNKTGILGSSQANLDDR